MTTIVEIAHLLRTTPENAARFIERVHEEISEPISDEDLLEIIRGINPRQLSLPKVIHAVRDYHKRLAARAAKRSARRGANASPETPAEADANGGDPEPQESPARRAVALVKQRSPGTLVTRIGEVLERNWDRAEREGYKPERFEAEAFIDVVRNYTDPRDATHARILAAIQELDRHDVVITPMAAADRVREMAF